jgi:lipopolysaccharide assembly protein A
LIIIILLLIVLIGSALFFAQNDAMVQIKYFSGSVELPMNWVLVTAFVSGILLGVAIMATSLLTAKLKLVTAKRKLTQMEKEVSNLRTVPIKNDY